MNWELPIIKSRQHGKFISKIPMSNFYVDEYNQLFEIYYTSKKNIIYIASVIQC